MRRTRPHRRGWAHLGKSLTEALPGGDRRDVQLSGVALAQGDHAAAGSAQHDAGAHLLDVHDRAGDDALTCEISEQGDIALDALPDPPQPDLDALPVRDHLAE